MPTTLRSPGQRLRIVLTSVHAWPEVVRGGERYVHELGAALHRAGHEVRIVASARRPFDDVVDGVPVHRVPATRAWPRRFGEQAEEVGFGLRCLSLMGARADVWHAGSTGDGAVAAVVGTFRPGLATVFTDHGFPVATSRQRREDRRLHRLIVDRIGAYVCVSAPAGAYLQRDYGRTASVVHPGVRTAAFAPGPRASRPTLLYAGSLTEPRKNVIALLAAADRLRLRVPDLQVWLHGPGTLPLADLPGGDLVTRSGVLAPHLLAARYAAAWATVLPSVAESFGMVVVESQASGTPAVVLADGGGPPTLVEDGITGTVAASASPEDLAVACGRALDLATAGDTADSCRSASVRYDWDAAIVPEMEEVYADAR